MQPRPVKFVGLFDGLRSLSGINAVEDIEVLVYTYGAVDLDVSPGTIAFASGDLCIMPNGHLSLNAHIVSV